MKKKYPIVIEIGEDGCSGHLPDLPGCVATGKTVEQVKERIESALQSYIEDMIEDGEPIPEPDSTPFQDDLDETCEVHYVDVEVKVEVKAA